MPSEQSPADETRALSRTALGDSAWRYLSAPDALPKSPALGRSTLADQARGAVLALIDEQGLGAGDALPSTGALAERFEVSKTVIREALSALAALGIIEITNGRSATVRPLDSSVVRFYLSRAVRESADDRFTALMDLRGPLEIRAAQVAARRVREASGTTPGTEEHEALVTPLRRLLDEMGAALADSSRYPVLDLHLHQEIARLSGNHALHGILEAVSTPLFQAMRDLRATRDEHGLVGAEHAQHVRIVEAILAGDEAASAAEMATHMTAVEGFGTGDGPGDPTQWGNPTPPAAPSPS